MVSIENIDKTPLLLEEKKDSASSSINHASYQGNLIEEDKKQVIDRLSTQNFELSR